MHYILNKDSIIFLDSDAQKGYKTIAYDWKNDKILEISPPLYHILKAMDSSGLMTEEELRKMINTFPSDGNYLMKAIEDLVERGIVIRHEH